MAEQKLNAKLGLDTKEYDAKLRNAEGGMKNFGAGLAKVGAAMAATFSVAMIANFAKKSLELYDVQAKAEQSLLVALKGRSDIQQRLIRQAQDLQIETLFGDEQTIEAASRLAMLIGANETAIKRLLPLVQDLAQAKFEGNLATAADMVAKSIGSSTNALSRYGIQIEGAVGSTGRLESAIKGMNEQVGGQAAAAAKAGLGPLTQLKNAWSDLKEEIGKAVIQGDLFQKGVPKMTSFLTAFNKIRSAGNLTFGQGLMGTLFMRDELLADIDAMNAAADATNDLAGATGGLGDENEDVGATIAELIKKIKEEAKEAKKLAEAIGIVKKEIAGEGPFEEVNVPGITGVTLDYTMPGAGGLRPAGQGATQEFIDQQLEINQALERNAKDLEREATAVYMLEDAFVSMFDNVDEGFKGMIDSIIKNLERLVAKLLAEKLVGLIQNGFNFTGSSFIGGGGVSPWDRNIPATTTMPTSMGGKLETDLKGRDIAISLKRYIG